MSSKPKTSETSEKSGETEENGEMPETKEEEKILKNVCFGVSFLIAVLNTFICVCFAVVFFKAWKVKNENKEVVACGLKAERVDSCTVGSDEYNGNVTCDDANANINCETAIDKKNKILGINHETVNGISKTGLNILIVSVIIVNMLSKISSSIIRLIFSVIRFGKLLKSDVQIELQDVEQKVQSDAVQRDAVQSDGALKGGGIFDENDKIDNEENYQNLLRWNPFGCANRETAMKGLKQQGKTILNNIWKFFISTVASEFNFLISFIHIIFAFIIYFFITNNTRMVPIYMLTALGIIILIGYLLGTLTKVEEDTYKSTTRYIYMFVFLILLLSTILYGVFNSSQFKNNKIIDIFSHDVLDLWFMVGLTIIYLLFSGVLPPWLWGDNDALIANGYGWLKYVHNIIDNLFNGSAMTLIKIFMVIIGLVFCIYNNLHSCNTDETSYGVQGGQKVFLTIFIIAYFIFVGIFDLLMFILNIRLRGRIYKAFCWAESRVLQGDLTSEDKQKQDNENMEEASKHCNQTKTEKEGDDDVWKKQHSKTTVADVHGKELDEKLKAHEYLKNQNYYSDTDKSKEIIIKKHEEANIENIRKREEKIMEDKLQKMREEEDNKPEVKLAKSKARKGILSADDAIILKAHRRNMKTIKDELKKNVETNIKKQRLMEQRLMEQIKSQPYGKALNKSPTHTHKHES
jgi:hypothetical protein